MTRTVTKIISGASEEERQNTSTTKDKLRYNKIGGAFSSGENTKPIIEETIVGEVVPTCEEREGEGSCGTIWEPCRKFRAGCDLGSRETEHVCPGIPVGATYYKHWALQGAVEDFAPFQGQTDRFLTEKTELLYRKHLFVSDFNNLV